MAANPNPEFFENFLIVEAKWYKYLENVWAYMVSFFFTVSFSSINTKSDSAVWYTVLQYLTRAAINWQKWKLKLGI